MEDVVVYIKLIGGGAGGYIIGEIEGEYKVKDPCHYLVADTPVFEAVRDYLKHPLISRNRKQK